MTDDVQWLTYSELAEAFEITPKSARNLARQKRWTQRTGQDRLARVGVPVDEIPVRIESSVGGPTASEVSLVAIKVLRERIGRLEAEIVSFKDEHDRERLRTAQVDALTAILDIERKRFEELRRERDQWAERAEATQQQVGALLRRRGV
jgi:hypothetical protein